MQYGSYNLLATYCNPKDVKVYDKVVKAMCKARQKQPLVMAVPKKGVPSRLQRNSGVVFVMLSSD